MKNQFLYWIKANFSNWNKTQASVTSSSLFMLTDWMMVFKVCQPKQIQILWFDRNKFTKTMFNWMKTLCLLLNYKDISLITKQWNDTFLLLQVAGTMAFSGHSPPNNFSINQDHDTEYNCIASKLDQSIAT